MMKHASIQELFSRAAERYADNVAIERGAQRITYGELEQRSNNLANFLVASGAPKGSIVAILAGDTINIVTAILAILKAGCAFAPFDPRIPEKRLEAMVEQISPQWLVIESEHFGKAVEVATQTATEARIICLDEGGATGAQGREGAVRVLDYASYLNAERPCVQSEPDDLCSIFFTSGSTGRPKGIAGRLKGIAHFAQWEGQTLGVGEGMRVSQLTSPSFDGFLKDVFVPLCAGGTVCAPASRDTILDARQLVEWIETERVNVLHCVPSLFRSIINAGLKEEYFSVLQYVVLAGEPLLPTDVKRWMEVYGERIRLVNLYGPTETTVTKLFHFVTPADQDFRSIPIGKPMPGAQALVVDAKGNACPPGTVGEIYIRTPFRALGYWGQPEKTAEVFVRNPFNDDPRDIVYKTGDYGRVLGDGTFEFLGRKDFQVKIRGVRIELGEIENLLRGHRAVSDVAVIDREDANGNKYLCAYIVAGEEEVAPGAFRAHLAGLLPDYMLPSAFVVLEKLPRTLNGKIDRRALPEPNLARGHQDDGFVAPRTPIEEILADIWSRVLNVGHVGVHDNFFELGGHSLLATQLLSSVRAALEVEISLRALFDAPTVAGLAQGIENALRAGDHLTAPPLRPVARDSALPISSPQQRMWFLDQLQPGNAAFNIPSVLRLRGTLDIAALERTLTEMVRRHEALRTTFSMQDGEPRQVIHPAQAAHLPVTDLEHLPAEEREREARRLIDEEARRPFDLSRGPLLRARLLRLSEEEHVVLFTMHHIVSDGWSMGVLVREVASLYAAYVQGEESPLAELEVQYADFAVWQRRLLQGETLEALLSYWREQLAGAPAVLELPTDRPRPAVQSYRGATYRFTVRPAVLASLKELSYLQGATLFMTLLAAWQTLLYRYTAQEEIVVGSPIANRHRAETESLIGYFANTLVMRGDLSGSPTFRELIGRVREMTLGAYMHQDLPFEKLVEELQPGRKSNYSPLFQVWFVLQNAPMPPLQLPGLSLQQMAIESGQAQFDLALSLSEVEQELRGVLDYQTDLFDVQTVAQMCEHFVALLEAVAANADWQVLDIPLGAGAEETGSYVEATLGHAIVAQAEEQFSL